MATLTRIHSHLSRTKASRFSPLLGWLLLLGVATVLSGCTHTPLNHRLIMKGQVVSVDSETIVVCVGSKDGAEMGQVLDVVRYQFNAVSSEGDEQYIRVPVGKVKLQKIVNEHFARAVLISGEVHASDMVELP